MRWFRTGDLASRGTLQPGYDLRQFCLRSLFELFIGAVPPESLMDRMYAYNEGLLALGKLSPEFEDGQKALDELTEFCLKHYRTVRAQGKVSAATARTRTPSVVSGELLGLATQQLSLTHALEERVTSIEGNHETMAEELERARGAFVSALSQHQLDAADADGALERAVASVFHLYALLRGTLARMSTVGTLLAPPDNSGLPAAIRATRDALAEGWDAVGAFERAAGGETGLGGADGLLFTPPSVPLYVQATELVTYTSEAAAAASM